MNVDYFRYLVLVGNFLNVRLCEIQLGAQCLLGEHGPLILANLPEYQNKLSSFQVEIHSIVVTHGKRLYIRNSCKFCVS